MTRSFASLPASALPLMLSIPFALASGCIRDAPIATEDGGTRDAATGCILCAPPPEGCRLEGGSCTSCGTLVCDDGGTDGGTCATPVDCAAPPPGCHYEGGDGCTTCGALVCDRFTCVSTGELFPEIGRECESSLDCTVGLHQIDCCGRLRAVGIRDDQRGTFDDAERLCQEAFPDCDCAPLPTEADDGTVDDGSREVRVLCVDHRCTSTFLPGEGDTCSPGGADACGAGLSCCYPCGIPGCEHRCEPSCDPSEPGCTSGCLLRP